MWKEKKTTTLFFQVNSIMKRDEEYSEVNGSNTIGGVRSGSMRFKAHQVVIQRNSWMQIGTWNIRTMLQGKNGNDKIENIIYTMGKEDPASRSDYRERRSSSRANHRGKKIL
ncbi:hypothetical protein ACI65C_005346 [Semiaphis heraclei]